MSGGMILQPADSGKADVVMSVKGDIVTYSTERVRKAVGNNSQILVCDSSETDGNKYDDNTTSFVVACSDETTDLETGDDKAQIRLPFQFELTSISANVNTAPTGSTISIQVQEDGSDILSTPITIDASETTSETAAVPPVISDSTLASNSIISFDLDQIGSSTAGTGLKINLIGYRVV